MVAAKDYYKVLQVDPSAEPEIVEAAYRRLARKYHPDVNSSSDAGRRMQDINEAHDVLSNPAKRAQFDLTRTEGFAQQKNSYRGADATGASTNRNYKTQEQSEAFRNAEQDERRRKQAEAARKRRADKRAEAARNAQEERRRSEQAEADEYRRRAEAMAEMARQAKQRQKTSSHNGLRTDSPPVTASGIGSSDVAFFLAIFLGLLLIAAFVSSSSSQSQEQTAVSACANGPSLKQYASAPPMIIDTGKQYWAKVKMTGDGEFVIQLYPDKAPITVNSFVFLAREGFFNCVTFHRVLEGFMAQGGDPTGTGSGGPGYDFVNEDSDLKFDKEGVVAMANAGRDTNGSQFFITFGPAEFLDGGYTIFGQVADGMDVVNAITRRDPQANPDFAGDMIESVTIVEK